MSVIKDSNTTHWVNSAPESIRPYLQLSRLDRPIGYWLLALPGWIGLAFATLSHGFAYTDLKWAALILIGAIAMRGAGCTYNDIVDQDLDAQVERTALRPLPAGTITSKQAWIWLFMQCGVGLIVLLCLPRLAQIISLCSIPLVAAYPFMKRITWWPQVWLGFTFNWAVLVAYAAKTGTISPSVLVLYAGLIFWTIGYDTVYACQDIEDDAIIGVKSTARKFGNRIKLGVGASYLTAIALIMIARALSGILDKTTYIPCGIIEMRPRAAEGFTQEGLTYGFISVTLFALHLMFWQVLRIDTDNKKRSLGLFKSNFFAALLLIIGLLLSYHVTQSTFTDGLCTEMRR